MGQSILDCGIQVTEINLRGFLDFYFVDFKLDRKRTNV